MRQIAELLDVVAQEQSLRATFTDLVQRMRQEGFTDSILDDVTRFAADIDKVERSLQFCTVELSQLGQRAMAAVKRVT